MGCSGSKNKQLSKADFHFGFNDPRFSDRVLHLMVGDECKSKVHVSSLFLSGQCNFFKTLFSSSDIDSDVKMQLENSEEVSGMMNLLKYLYSLYDVRELTDPYRILDLLLIAERLNISSCVEDCVRLLQTMDYIDFNFAVTCFKLLPTSSTLAVKRLRTMVETKLIEEIRAGNQQEVLIPASVIKFVVKDDRFHCFAEYEAFMIVFEWGKKNYNGDNKRLSGALDKLMPYMRFWFMTKAQLKTIAALHEVYDCRTHMMEALLNWEDNRTLRLKRTVEAPSQKNGTKISEPVGESSKFELCLEHIGSKMWDVRLCYTGGEVKDDIRLKYSIGVELSNEKNVLMLEYEKLSHFSARDSNGLKTRFYAKNGFTILLTLTLL